MLLPWVRAVFFKLSGDTQTHDYWLLCCWNSLSQAGEWCQGRTRSPSNSSSPESLPLPLTLLHFPACQDATRMCLHSASATILSILLFHCSLNCGQGRAEGSSTLTWLNGVDQSVMPMWFPPSFAFLFLFLLLFRRGIVSALSCVQ